MFLHKFEHKFQFHNWKAPLAITLSPWHNILYDMAPDIWEMGLSSLGNYSFSSTKEVSWHSASILYCSDSFYIFL